MQEKNQQLQEIVQLVTAFLVQYSFRILGAILILVIGFWIASHVAAMFGKFLERKKIDVTLSHFAAGVVKFIIVLFALIMALDKLGITMTPFVAALSGAAFGASFAFQGPLMNYGAGLTIILTRPFVVGDTITVTNCSGVVEDISLALTTLRDEDGVRITIPNKHIVGEVLYNSKKFKVVEQKIGIAYDSDTQRAVALTLELLSKHPEVSQQPKPQVGIGGFGDFAVTLEMRYWVATERYYQTMFAVNQSVFDALKAAKITIPFPQREVRIVGNATASFVPPAQSPAKLQS